jgi:hypothetical protein
MILDEVRRTSPAFDENIYLPAGYSYVATGDFRLNLEHPPLSKVLAGVAVYPLHPKETFASPNWTSANQVGFGLDFLYRGLNSTKGLFAVARLSNGMLALLLGLGIYLAARRYFGDAAGVLALALWVFYPDGLAHAGLATPDLPSAFFIFLAAGAALLFLEQPSPGRGLMAAFTFGLALLTKHTALLLFPYLGVLGLVAGMRRKPHVMRVAVGGVVFIAVVLSVLWAGYFFHAQPDLKARFDLPSLPLPGAYMAGFKIAGALISHRLCYYLGAPHPGHPPGFFPISFLLKTPVPLLILFFLSPLLVPIRKTWPFLLFAGMLFASALASPFPFGQRYLLPMYPFLAVAAGAGAAKLLEKSWDRVFLGVLLLWLMAGTLFQHPDHLAYFNEFAGSKDEVYRHFVDSNLDWGTQLPALKAWMDRSRVDHIYLSYFGTTDPAAYGIRYTPLPAYHQDLYYPEKAVARYVLPKGAWIAVSATNLVGLYQPRYFSELVPMDRPDAVIGQSIFLWRMTESWNVAYDASRNPPWEFERADAR